MRDFYAFRKVCDKIAQEGRNIATVDLTILFMWTKRKEKDDVVLMIAGVVLLLLVYSDAEKWMKH